MTYENLANESAYPQSLINQGDYGIQSNASMGYGMGMTIRQRYAMAAMQGILSDVANTNELVDKGGDFNKSKEAIAWTAFQLADGMIQHEVDEYAKKQKEDKLGDKTT